MELKLTNFRCYRNITVRIPESGMIRIKGVGGIGKSTILNGIYFALYGKCRKPFTHGSKTCCVELKYERYNLSITRSKQPSNRLLILYKNKQYEDDSAQGIINSVLGMTHDEFYASSYFDQRKQSSILSMSPADQLSFIEAIAFGSDSLHEETKTKTKENAKALRKERDGVLLQLSLIDSQCNACNINIAKLKETGAVNHEDPEDLDEIKSEISNISEEISELRSLLKTKRVELKKIQSQDVDNRKAEDDRLKLETQIQLINSQIENLGEIKSEEEIVKLKDTLISSNQLIHNMKKFLDVESMKKQYEDGINEHIISTEQKIKGIETLMMKDADSAINALSKFEKLKPILDEEDIMLKKYKESINCAKEGILHIRDTLVTDHDVDDPTVLSIEIGKVTTKTWLTLKSCIDTLITNYTKDITDTTIKLNNVQCESWYCPKCKTPICEGEDNTLIIRTIKKGKKEHTKDDIPNLQMMLRSFQSNIDTLHNLIENGDMYHRDLSKPIPKKTKNDSGISSSDDYKQLLSKLEEHKLLVKLHEEYHEIVKKRQPPPQLKKYPALIKEKLKGLPKDIEATNEYLELCEKDALSLEKNIEKAWHRRGNHSKLVRELKALEKNLNTSKRLLKPKGVNQESLLAHISEMEHKIDVLNDKLSHLNDRLSFAEGYSTIKYATDELKKLQDTQNNANEKLSDLNDCIKGAEELEKMAVDAELLSLEKTIATINRCAKVYLQNLFDLPIVAMFRIKTTTKKGKEAVKPGIEIYVEYKGDIYDDIDEFSGSERQRCDLAFLFAVNDVLGSNIIMLDECFNNLDDDMAINTLGYIEEILNNDTRKLKKQVLIISHRISDGVFEHVVDPLPHPNKCSIKTALG